MEIEFSRHRYITNTCDETIGRCNNLISKLLSMSNIINHIAYIIMYDII